jgi:hypothetical protein
VVIVKGRDELGVGRHLHRVDGDLTVLADGRPALMTADEEVHDLGDVLAALPDDLGPLLDHASRGHVAARPVNGTPRGTLRGSCTATRGSSKAMSSAVGPCRTASM